MKTTNFKILVGFIVFLWGSGVRAQNYAYMGGSADGSALESVINNTCNTPYHFYAYAGGTADGAAVNTIADNACETPFHFYAYAGGEADGAAVNTVSDNVCDTPYHFNAYFGGNADGAATEMLKNCADILPKADFTSNVTTICSGQEVQFTDKSTNAVAWEWTFAGGTVVSPTTLTSQNPKVKYNTAGSYKVTLKVRNADGSDEKAVTGYILVSAVPPAITSAEPGATCGPGTVVLKATPSFGTVDWYTSATGGTKIGTGTTFTTPFITATTTYYAQAVNESCLSATRTAVKATVAAGPTFSTSGTTICNGGNATVSASTSEGKVYWYDAETGGNELGTGNTYTTAITQTRTFWAEVRTAACTTPRKAAVATATTTAAPTGDSTQTFCHGATVGNLTATGTAVKWYDAASGGNLLPSSTMLVENQVYYASQTINGCESTSRLAVTVIKGACLGLSEAALSSMKVYPVPVNDVLYIDAKTAIISLKLYSADGKIVISKKASGQKERMDVNALPQSSYILRVETADGIKTVKIIKK